MHRDRPDHGAARAAVRGVDIAAAHCPRLVPPQEVPGFVARRLAADILEGVLHRRRPLDEQIDDKASRGNLAALPERDRALVRALVASVLRRLGTLRHLLHGLLARGLPADAPRVETALLIGAAQILWLEVPDHAAVDLAVRLVQADRRAARYAGLVNAVLRRVAREGAPARSPRSTWRVLDTPDWLMARWVRALRRATPRARSPLANGREPALDLTVKTDPAHWAQKLGGRVLATGSVRAVVHGPVAQLPGYAEGAWWVQDAAAALPARLLGDVQRPHRRRPLRRARRQDRAARRRRRARDRGRPLAAPARAAAAESRALAARCRNRRRRRHAMAAPARSTPCCSMRPARRPAPSAAIPDIPWLKRDADIAALAALQRRLIARAAELTKPGGTLVYCTCSLEPEEGADDRREPFSPATRAFGGMPISARRVAGRWRLAHDRRRPAHPAVPPAGH